MLTAVIRIKTFSWKYNTMTESAYDRAIQAAQEQYITGDISIYRFELIVEDAIRRKDALESPGKEWERFAHDHNISEIDMMPSLKLEGEEVAI